MENKKYGQEWRKADSGRSFSKNMAENSAPKKVSSEEQKKTIQNFRDLKIWQLGKEIALEAYKVTQGFPREELYGLTAQMRRAAVSVPCNISEGHSRRATKDYQRFLKIAAGSCAELETQTEIALTLGYLNATACEGIMERIDHERRMLRKLIGKLSEDAIRPPSSAIQGKERVPSPLEY